MSDRMRPIAFGDLMTQAITEYRKIGSLFGVTQLYRHQGGKLLPLFGETVETPFGPAAGPHTQLCQNLIAAYAGGSRFFELKTVQTLDGEDLHVAKPCILAAQEGYNVEWSTELTVAQAMDEYIKGWFALKLLSRELGLGSPTGFVFNMSVGYDLEGIKSPKIDGFIEGLKDASHTACFGACTEWALANLHLFEHVDEAFVKGISPRICGSITLSTLHGCPPDEIERIATYLIEQKGLHTFVKCNPTLLGYEFARTTLNSLGYDELVFDDHHFKDDLQFSDAVPMFTRLLERANKKGVSFGVKLSNTFPVTIARGELPGDEMYMSGKALFPLTISLTGKLEQAFGGQLRASYSGGADAHNIADIFSCGIWPITLATTLLKPGGYNRLQPMAQALAAMPYADFDGVDQKKLDALCQTSMTDAHYQRPVKPQPDQKLPKSVPLLDCFVAPCHQTCPIHQDIPAYLALVEAGDYEGAMRIITQTNPLPTITGTICAHKCQTACTRRFYEDSVHIRAAKLVAAQNGLSALLATLAPNGKRAERVAVIGGGPGGMAAAFFAARAGASVTLFEKRDSLGGIVKHVIPAFRISDDAIDADAKLLHALGVDIRLNSPVSDVSALYEQGFTHVIVAVGAWQPSRLPLEKGESMNVLAFLEAAKKQPNTLPTAAHVVVVGGGNTAMDAARAATRLPSTKDVTIVYRRTRRQMPADLEELELAIADGVQFRELANPAMLQNGKLTLTLMRLGAPDASGRQSPVPTGETEQIPCDLLIAAIGDAPDSEYLKACGVTLDSRGRATSLCQSGTLCLIGDALRGPATVVEAIADARDAVNALLGDGAASAPPAKRPDPVGSAELLAKHGKLCECTDPKNEANRCLNCGELCENCVDVCPNRANIAVLPEGCQMPQIVHVDALCNECGNCAAFCPYQSKPYRDKLTLYRKREDFENSDNEGFLPLSDGRVRIRHNGQVYEDGADMSQTPQGIAALIRAALDVVDH